MTEKELMLAGELYDSRDPELIARYQFVRNILSKINGYPLISMTEKTNLFSQLLGKLGENVWIETPFFL